MAKSMEDRKKTGPLLGKWTAIKGSHKALGNGALFKPDIAAPVKSYDDGLKTYDKLLEDKKKLKDLFRDASKASQTYHDEREKHNAERDKIDAKEAELRDKYGDQIDNLSKADDPATADVIAALTGFTSALDEGQTMHKALTDRLVAMNAARSAAIKKVRDAYKAKADAIAAGLKKLETDGDRLEGQIKQIGLSYEKTAVQMDHDEIVDDIRGFLDNF